MHYLDEFNTNFFWTFPVPDFDELLTIVDEDIASDEGIPDEGLSWNRDCIVRVIGGLQTKKYQKFIHEPVDRLASDLGIPMNFKISQPWINVYERGAFQETHHHSPAALAAVIFLNGGEDFSEFYFFNTNTISSPWYEVFNHRMKVPTDMLKPNIEPGNVILFPGYMLHGVSAHRSDTPRKTLAFNILMETLY